jgi:glycosyltransferase 2 family protein
MLLAALGVVLYLAAAIATDATRLREALIRLGWTGTIAVLLLSAVNYLLRFYRWTTYIERLGHHIPVFRHLLYYLGGFAFTVSPAKAGEAVRSLYLREHGISYSESIATLFVERLLDLLSMVVLASLIVFYGTAYRSLLIAAALTVLLLLVGICQPAAPRLVAAFAQKRPPGRTAKLLAILAGLLSSSQRLLQPRMFLTGVLLGLLSWGAEGLGFHLICQGLQLNINVFEAIGIYSISVLIGSAAVFLPAGIGGMELVMTAFLVSGGASLPVAVLATLLCRIATLWFAVLIGLIAAAILELSFTRRRACATP